MESQVQKRQTAYKTDIATLKRGTYIKEEGFQPNYLKIGDLKISRANILAVIVSEPLKEANTTEFSIDDGTGDMQVRSFEELKSAPKIGMLAFIIGRPREYNGQVYLIPEIIKEVKDKKWIEVRKKELFSNTKMPAPPQEIPESTQIIQAPEDNITKILQIIKEEDTGDGALFESIIEKSKIEEAESILTSLLKEGEIFEIAPGRVKVLE